MNEKYVSCIADHIAVINGLAQDFEGLHGIHIKQPETGKIEIWLDADTHEEKARILSYLRDKGYAFSYGAGWSPSEIFEYYKENNLLKGKYKRIYWENPKSCKIEYL